MRALGLLILVASCAPPSMTARPVRVTDVPGVERSSSLFRGTGGVELFAQSWRPVDRAPRAVLVIHHGLKSHSALYDWFARRMVARGHAVHAYDMRGHGRSSGQRAGLDDFAELSADLDLFLARVRAREPGRPIFLAGHSVGGAVVTFHVLERRPALAGLIVMAPAVRVDQPPIAAAGARIAGALMPNLPVVNVPDEQFSRSPGFVRAMGRDPLIYHDAGPARTGAAVTRALARIWPRVAELDLPLLGLHGTADQATSPRGTAELVRRAGSRDKELLLYRGLYHDLLHEPEREQVADDIERWIDRRAPR